MSEPTLPEITLPIWMNKGRVSKIAAAAHAWFTLLMGYALWPLGQLDPMTCSEQCLDLIAWQRDITRFPAEPLELYRLRIAHAYANAIDSGSVAGFKRIFQRLGIGYVELEERIDGQDWDVINIIMSDSQLAENDVLLDVLIQHYGRTCRRYGWVVITPIPMEIQVVEFANDTITSLAVMEE
jgi:hypothetical protein